MRTEKSPQQAQSLPVQGWALKPQPQTTLNKYQVSIDNHLLLLLLQLHIFQIRETSSVRFTWAYRHVAKCVYWFYVLSCYLFLACCQDVLRENCYILSRTRMFSLSRMEIQFTINLIYFYFSSSPLIYCEIYFYLTLLSVSVIVCIIVQFYFQVGPFHNK